MVTCSLNAMMAESAEVVFCWQDCCQVPEQGGRGSNCGVGLAEWEGEVVWRGSEGEMEKLNEGKWSRMATKATGVGKATLVIHMGKLLVIGGVEEGVASKKVWQWRKKRKKWEYPCGIPDLPVGCSRPCVVSMEEGRLVVMGGSGDRGVALNVVQVYCGRKKAWSLGASLPAPCACGPAVLEDWVVLLGGNNMSALVWRAKASDLLTEGQQGGSIWKHLPNVPYCWSSGCVVDGVLLAIGGQDTSLTSKKTSSIHAFSERLQTWLPVGNVPFECSLVDNTVLSTGGLMVVDGSSRRVVLGSVKDLHERLRCLEYQAPLKEEVSRLKEELRKPRLQLEPAVTEEERESTERENELISSHHVDETDHLSSTSTSRDMEEKQESPTPTRSNEGSVSALESDLIQARSDLIAERHEVSRLKQELESSREASKEREKELASQYDHLRKELEGIKEKQRAMDAQLQALRDTKLNQSRDEDPKNQAPLTSSSSPDHNLERNPRVSEIFRAFYATMKETLNPDDLTHTLYSENVISKSDRDEISHHLNTQSKTESLLQALERAIGLDSKNFDIFLSHLRNIPKYEHLREEMDAAKSKLS